MSVVHETRTHFWWINLLLWLPRRPSLQRDVTKQFIRKHTHKDPYPGAPYKVLPELAIKYNLVTEVSDLHGSITKIYHYGNNSYPMNLQLQTLIISNNYAGGGKSHPNKWLHILTIIEWLSHMIPVAKLPLSYAYNVVSVLSIRNGQLMIIYWHHMTGTLTMWSCDA